MRKLLVAAAAMVALSGCGIGATDLPLPGTGVSGDTYKLSAVFDDALNLPIGAPVKLDGVPIGKVRTVESRDFKAYVEMELKTSHRLHTDAEARLRSTTPLGELYVEMHDGGKGEELKAGDELGTDLTSAAPSIEDSMSAASLLLNGGNLGQLRSIVREANAALDGREMTARQLLNRLTTTVEAFSASSEDIDRSLEALASVSTTLNKREDTINAVLRDLPAAAKVLHDNTDELTKMLQGIKSLSAVSQRVVDQTGDDVLKILKQAGPVLDQLVALDDEFAPGLQHLIRLAGLLDEAVPSDHLNVYLYFDDSLALGLPIDLPLGSGLPPIETPEVPDLGLPDLEIPGLTGPGAPGDNPPDIGLGGLLSGLSGGQS